MPEPHTPPRRGLWRVADFRNLWASQTVSLFGTAVTLLALPLLALTELDASPFEIGALWAAEYIPILLVGLAAGVWVERLPRRTVMIVSDVARAAALLAVPAAVALDMLSMPLLYTVAFIIGLGTLFFDVAQLSILPALVDEDRLVDANGKLEVSRSAAQVGGPALGGFLVAALTAPIAVVADALSYLGSALFAYRITTPPPTAEPVERLTLRRDISEGMRFVFGHPLMRPLLLCALLAELAFAIVLALQVVFASDELHMNAVTIGVVFAVGNAGGAAGALLAEPLARRLGTGAAFLTSIVLFTAGTVLLPLAGGPVLFCAGLVLSYLGAFIFNVLQVSLCQTVTPTRLLGRMNSVFRFVTWGVIPVGALGGGLLVDAVGLRGVFWIAAVLNVLSFLPPLLSAVRTLPADYADRYSGGELVEAR